MSAVTIISSDGHVGPDEEMYRPFLETRFHSDFDEYLQYRTPTRLVDLNKPAALEAHVRRWYDTGAYEAMWDPAKRLAILEAEGAVAEILFPDRTRNDEIPFSESPYPGCEPHLRVAGERAYNRWLAAFCGAHPERFGGLAVLSSFTEPDDMVTEILWVAEQPGLRGVQVPGVGPDRNDWLDPRYERVWSACEDTALVVTFHVGAGAPPSGGVQYPTNPAGSMIATFESWWWTQRALWWLIYGGVLERHPELRVVFTETGSAWVADKLASMDWFSAVPHRLAGVHDSLPLKPSEYFHRQCAVGSSILSLADVERRHAIGVDNMMFGLDVPHLEGTTWITLPYLQRTFGAAGATEAETRAILGGNAARIYGFDASHLQRAAERVGPAIEDVLSPVGADDIDNPEFYWVARPV